MTTKSAPKSRICVLSLFTLIQMAGFATYAQLIPSDFDLAKVPKKQSPLLGQSITVDTRKPETCKEIRTALDPKHSNRKFDELCKPNEARPYSTVVIVQEPSEEASAVLYKLNPGQIQHVNNGRNVLILGTLVVGRFIATGIEEANWKRPTNGIVNAWADHVSRPPVIDKDNFRTNFIEHPISGAVYYSIARHSGFSMLESFGFSVFSSTFLWEYGLEAIFERPSINDLIVTPVLGSLIGELFYQTYQSIERNDGKVLGSRTVGTAVQVITNPGYYFSEGLNELLGGNWFKEGDIGWVVRDRANRPGIVPMSYQDSSRELALRFRLRF